jgi:hypothetical protein
VASSVQRRLTRLALHVVGVAAVSWVFHAGYRWLQGDLHRGPRGPLWGWRVDLVQDLHSFLAVVAVALVIALVALPDWRPPVIASLRRTIGRAPGGVALVMVFAFLTGGANGWLDTPVPHNPDEFSNLLLADTLLEGRLANPVPQPWENFEAIAVILDPTYASKYPPAQGAVLALGTLLGHPWIGAWLSMVAAAGLVTWMLYRWVTPRFALAGGLLIALHPSMQAFEQHFHARINLSWSHGYFGGALALGSGAVLMGVLGRRRRQTWELFAFAAALLVLANTRPMEGLLVALPATALLVVDAHRERFGWGRFAAPLLAVLVPGALWIAYYNWRITGSITQFPHRLYAEQYSAAAMFIWQEPNPFPTYVNDTIELFYRRYQRPTFEAAVADLWGSRWFEVGRMIQFYGMPALAGLIGLPLAWRRRYAVPLVQCALLTITGLSVMSWLPHYFAPALAGGLVLLMVGLQALAQRLPQLAAALLVTSLPLLAWQFEPTTSTDWSGQRAAILADLHAQGGKHLVLVAGRRPFNLWVRNRADMDDAPVVWAIRRGNDQELIEAYPGRTVWRMNANQHRVRLFPVGGDED